MKGLRVFFGLSIASIATLFLFTMRKETLDANLASLYEVETKILVQAVKSPGPLPR